MQIDDDERRARLALRHRLTPDRRTDDLPQLADDLVGLHSSDPVSVYLSAMARMGSPSIEAVDAALYEQRALIRHHAMRRTLWVATRGVVREMHGAATRKLVAPERRRTIGMLGSNGVAAPEAWLDDARQRVLADLAEHGPSTAREVGQRVASLRHPIQLAQGKPYAGVQGAHSRVLTLLGFEGRIVRTRPVSWITGAYRYALAEDWLPGGFAALDERVAAAALADRWLRRFGPASATDLQWWMGWTVAMTRRALADSGAIEVGLTDGPGWLAADDEPVAAPGEWVALLPGLDPTTMGWKQRAWYLPESAADAFDSVGNAGPTIWVDGRVVGAWAQTPDGTIVVHYFERVGAARRREVRARADEIAAWVGETRFTVRFPSRAHSQLLGRVGYSR